MDQKTNIHWLRYVAAPLIQELALIKSLSHGESNRRAGTSKIPKLYDDFEKRDMLQNKNIRE